MSLPQDLRSSASLKSVLPRKIPKNASNPPSEPRRGDTSSGDLDPAAVAVAVALPAPSGGLGTQCEITGRFLASRREDFHRQSTAQKLLKDQRNPKGKPYRIVHCTHTVKNKIAGVDVLIGRSGKAKFSGLQTCGSVWNCRPCQKKITRLREAEIQSAMDQHFGGGGTCYMITFTHGHKAHDELLALVDGYADAMAYMTSLRAYKKLVREFCLAGKVRALETTFGFAKGWHPHGHELHFRNGKNLTKAQVKELTARLFLLWLPSCQKFGLPDPSERRGVDVRVAWSAAEYMSKFGSDQKWGAGKELTRLNSKKSECGERFTPFDLLRAYDKGYKPEAMCMLFREFSFAYFGRRQLFWSPGLKARFAIEEIEDDEAVGLVEEDHTKAGTIEYQDWRKIIRQSRDRRVDVLESCEKGGFAATRILIDGMPGGVVQPEEAAKPTYKAKQKTTTEKQPAFWEKHARKPRYIAPHVSYTIVYLGCSESHLVVRPEDEPSGGLAVEFDAN